MSSSKGDPSNKMPWFKSFNRQMKNVERANQKAQKQNAKDNPKKKTAEAPKPAEG